MNGTGGIFEFCLELMLDSIEHSRSVLCGCLDLGLQHAERVAHRAEVGRVLHFLCERQRAVDNDFDEVEFADPDLELFLRDILPLLSSRNSAVIVAVTRAYLNLSPNNYLQQSIGPLVALLRTPEDIQQVALYNIVQVCLTNPTYFTSYFRHFLIRSTEGPHTWQLKLEVLTLIFTYGIELGIL